MRLPLSLLLVFGCKAVLGSLGDRASLSATAPVLDDEEKYASYMPAHLRCDACRAVAYQVSSACPSAVLRPLCHHWPLIPSPHPQAVLSPCQFSSPLHLNCYASVYPFAWSPKKRHSKVSTSCLVIQGIIQPLRFLLCTLLLLNTIPRPWGCLYFTYIGYMCGYVKPPYLPLSSLPV